VFVCAINNILDLLHTFTVYSLLFDESCNTLLITLHLCVCVCAWYIIYILYYTDISMCV
jgi:hypothetical protein